MPNLLKFLGGIVSNSSIIRNRSRRAGRSPSTSRGTIHTLIDVHDRDLPTRVSLQMKCILDPDLEKEEQMEAITDLASTLHQVSETLVSQGWSKHEDDRWERQYTGSRLQLETSLLTDLPALIAQTGGCWGATVHTDTRTYEDVGVDHVASAFLNCRREWMGRLKLSLTEREKRKMDRMFADIHIDDSNDGQTRVPDYCWPVTLPGAEEDSPAVFERALFRLQTELSGRATEWRMNRTYGIPQPSWSAIVRGVIAQSPIGGNAFQRTSVTDSTPRRFAFSDDPPPPYETDLPPTYPDNQ